MRVEVTDSGKHFSLLRYGKITALKSFIVQAPERKPGACTIKHFTVVIVAVL